MSFQNHIKQVAPKLSQIKSRQPAMLLGNKVIVAGIGGNFIPGAQSSSDSTSTAVADISAGYITVSDSVVTLHDLTKGITSIADKIYIPDTGVEEPDYAAGGTPYPVPGVAGVVDVYKVTSTSPLTGVKATKYQSDTWQFQSQSVSLIADPKNTPTKDYIYIASGTQLIGARIKSLSVIPTEGLVFNAPLTEWTGTAETGQTLTKYNSSYITQATHNGLSGQDIAAGGSIKLDNLGDIPVGQDPFTLFMQVFYVSAGKCQLFSYGYNDRYDGVTLALVDGYLGVGSNYGNGNALDNDYIQGVLIPVNTQWHSACLTRDQNTFTLYVDSQLVASYIYSGTLDIGSGVNYYGIGGRGNVNAFSLSGTICVRNVRIYNRVLNTTQIAALSGL